MKPRLTCFDLDHTLLSGDSDVFWCDFLIQQGVLDAATFAAKNADMEARYKTGTVGLEEFANFYVGTLAGRTPRQWEALRQLFLRTCIVPNIPASALALVKHHQDAGDLVVLTTATNRFITELTAQHLGITHLIATESALQGGVFTGSTHGTLNMRRGKVARLQNWLAIRHQKRSDFFMTAYSDSINDHPLLEMADQAVAVDPDLRLKARAKMLNWSILKLKR
jgi:HAD superfamily hydrolase (TIGR01490 family)